MTEVTLGLINETLEYARLSEFGYCGEEATEQYPSLHQWAEENRYENPERFFHNKINKIGVNTATRGNTLYIVPEGSSSTEIKHYIMNLKFWRDPGKLGVGFEHRGFGRALDTEAEVDGQEITLYNRLRTLIDDRKADAISNRENGPFEIVIVGHSMGGALGMDLARRLHNDGYGDDIAAIRTFGAPRTVGPQGAAMDYEIFGDRLLRIQHPRDLVTHLPFERIELLNGYRSSGRELNVADGAAWLVEPSEIETLERQQTAELDAIEAELTDKTSQGRLSGIAKTVSDWRNGETSLLENITSRLSALFDTASETRLMLNLDQYHYTKAYIESLTGVRADLISQEDSKARNIEWPPTRGWDTPGDESYQR